MTLVDSETPPLPGELGELAGELADELAGELPVLTEAPGELPEPPGVLAVGPLSPEITEVPMGVPDDMVTTRLIVDVEPGIVVPGTVVPGMTMVVIMVLRETPGCVGVDPDAPGVTTVVMTVVDGATVVPGITEPGLVVPGRVIPGIVRGGTVVPGMTEVTTDV